MSARPLTLLLLAGAAVTALSAQQTPPPDLSDPEVAHVAVTANTIDIDLARYAQSRSRSDVVKRFAA